jgi:hypothetical protein
MINSHGCGDVQNVMLVAEPKLSKLQPQKHNNVIPRDSQFKPESYSRFGFQGNFNSPETQKVSLYPPLSTYTIE